jgi:hypothetical protein
MRRAPKKALEDAMDFKFQISNPRSRISNIRRRMPHPNNPQSAIRHRPSAIGHRPLLRPFRALLLTHRDPGALPQADMSGPFRAVNRPSAIGHRQLHNPQLHDPQLHDPQLHDPQSARALKGQNMSAQGNALGMRPRVKSPDGAQQGRTQTRQFRMASVAVLVFLAAFPAFAADDKTDTVVLGVEGNETFEFYQGEGYTTANTPAAALALFNTTTNAKYTRLLILKNAATNAATVIGEWTWPSMTTPPGNLKKIEGGSLTKPYDVILHGTPLLALFDLTDVGEDASPFVIRGVTLTGGFTAVSANGDSRVELDQCYIREQAADVAGVVVGGSAVVKLTNCVFYKNYDGILIDGAAAAAAITFCTFYDNRASGVHVLNGGTATVINTLMYRNAAYGIWDESIPTPLSTVSTSNSNDNATGQYNPTSLQGADSYSEIVEFVVLTPAWQGKMASSIYNLNTLNLHRGVSVSGVSIDFEGEGRGSSPFIGADELNPNLAIGFWTRCEVYFEPIGRLGADVLINYSGTIPDLATSLCLLPDGVDANDLAHDINVPLEGGDGIYWGRVPELSWDLLGDGYIADSDNARFVLRLAGGEVLGDVLEDENTYILGQAREGYKGIVIDTIPPVVDLSFYSPETLVRWNSSLEAATTGGAASFAALGPFLPADAFPYETAITGWPQVTAPAETHAVFAPYVSPPAEPPKFFYNIGSVANGYYTGNDWLFLTIQATFIDPDVYTAKQLPADGFTRTPSGFNAVDIGTETGLPATYFSDACLARGLPAAWRVEPLNQQLQAPAVVDFACTVTPAGTSMTATWNLAVPVTVGAGWIEHFDLIGDFIAQDKAANYFKATEIDKAIVPPLQISWLSGYGTQVDFRTRMYGAWPEVAWSLNDTKLNINRLNAANPRPIYSYRIWGAETYGLYAGPMYVPLTGWSPWTPDNVLSASFFDQNINDNFGSPITDRWLIMVVAGCDEAGNVTPWDGYQWPVGSEPGTLELEGANIRLLNFDKTSGRNWIRFYIPGKTTQIDTVLYANLYYVDGTGARQDLGPAPIVSYPLPGVRLFAEFNARLLVNDPALWNGLRMGLKFSGQENGLEIFGSPGFAYVESMGTDMVRFDLPYNGAPPQLGNASNVMTYTVSAAAVADLWADYALEDQTPATFSFKVVPGSVDEYLRSSGGQQPVKQFETR